MVSAKPPRVTVLKVRFFIPFSLSADWQTVASPHDFAKPVPDHAADPPREAGVSGGGRGFYRCDRPFSPVPRPLSLVGSPAVFRAPRPRRGTRRMPTIGLRLNRRSRNQPARTTGIAPDCAFFKSFNDLRRTLARRFASVPSSARRSLTPPTRLDTESAAAPSRITNQKSLNQKSEIDRRSLPPPARYQPHAAAVGGKRQGGYHRPFSASKRIRNHERKRQRNHPV